LHAFGGRLNGQEGGSTKIGGTKKTGGRKTAATRELIDTGTDKRFVRRGVAGKF
jgi:hypothetical protein